MRTDCQRKRGVLISDMNTNVQDYVEPAKRQISRKFQDVQQRVTNKARHVSQKTDRYVHKNPWVTIGMVALAACMLGWLLKSASAQD